MTSLDPGPPPADVAVRRERFGSLAYDYTDRRLTFRRPKAQAADVRLTDELKGGLDAPICLTWELTYGCNLACIHCLSSSGRRDPRELTTAKRAPSSTSCTISRSSTSTSEEASRPSGPTSTS